MKTINELQKELDNIMQQDRSDLTPPQVSRLQSRAAYLRHCIYYLQTHPTEDFIRKESERLSNRISQFDVHYPLWVGPAGLDDKQKRSTYEREMGYAKIKQQLKTLNFLLQ